MACTHGLHGLAFSAIGGAPERPIVARADCVAAIPEFGSDATIAGVLDHAALFPAFDFPSNFRRKLKMIAAVVDGPGTVRVHQDRVVGVSDQIVVLPCAK